MNKNAIQKYAIWARNELIGQVKQRAFQYGVSDKGYGDENATIVVGSVLSSEERAQRREFISKVKEYGYQHAVEEVAYTWFNRFIALRFMEVNDYLPTHVRVFSDANGGFNPEILRDVLHIELEGLDRARVSALLNANKTEELYRYLLLTQCNTLNAALPEMFEKLGSYTEMLLPNNILKQDGVLGRLVADIPEQDFRDAVQIIGWMYQYYNTEPKQAVFDELKKNVKISKEKIPAATQLFTPDWIVRYMVENSLGRLWLERHPNAALKANWKYYLEEAEQTPEVTEQLRTLRSQSPVRSPEDIRLIDPCMGSGHILVYAFDVLMQIYISEGYSERDATKLILEKNLYGLDIDRRAYQLAYFSLMMKARQYNRRILTESIKPQIYHPAGWSEGEEYGSLLKVDALPPKPEEKSGQLSLEDTSYELQLRIWNFKCLLAQKYDVVVTNPPYAGSSGVNVKLANFLKEKFPDGKSDMFSSFMERGLNWIKPAGYNCMVTMQSWMFLSSFEIMRKKILSMRTITNLLHMENMVMGIAFGTAVANLFGQRIDNYKGHYNYVTMKDIDEEKPIKFPTAHKRNRISRTEDFEKIPGCPVAYWVSKSIQQAFKNEKIANYAYGCNGLTTGNNDLWLRFWTEVQINRVCFNTRGIEDSSTKDAKWFPYNKGGDFRKWYGNNDYVINWAHNGIELRNSGHVVLRSLKYQFKQSISWSKVSSGSMAFRLKNSGHMFDVAGLSLFVFDNRNLNYVIGFCNTKVALSFSKVLSPTLNYEVGHITSFPMIVSTAKFKEINEVVDSSISLSRLDWDSFETSWDFKRHPLNKGERSIAEAFTKWEQEATDRFDTLKVNEEELNRIFIDIYSLQDELIPDVEDKSVTVRRADLGRDIRSLISYAVGCMFGRYSLDVEGLAYAGGKWDMDKYKTFIPDKDNILPICDDEYFYDDIVGRFVEFVKTVYCADTLEENLRYIADALGGKGTPREVLRSYFLNDFYADHCRIYQKRPIYWLFDSGKKNGFKALIYLHRYTPDLFAKLRTDYVHEQQERYRTQLSHIAVALNNATGAERARLLKQQDKLSEQLQEITAYEELIHHLADQNIEIDLDDGVKKNYEIFSDVLAKI